MKMHNELNKSLSSRRLPPRQPPYDENMKSIIESTAFEGLGPRNLRLALAQHPALGSAFQAMAHVVLFECDVPERLREIAIIRTGALTRCEYEWGMHVSIYGEQCGLDDDAIMDITLADSWRELTDARWTEDERLVIRMVDELHAHSTISDATWSRMVSTWPQKQVIELIFATSIYHTAAFFLNSTAVPLQDGQAKFPAKVRTARVP